MSESPVRVVTLPATPLLMGTTIPLLPPLSLPTATHDVVPQQATPVRSPVPEIAWAVPAVPLLITEKTPGVFEPPCSPTARHHDALVQATLFRWFEPVTCCQLPLYTTPWVVPGSCPTSTQLDPTHPIPFNGYGIGVLPEGEPSASVSIVPVAPVTDPTASQVDWLMQATSLNDVPAPPTVCEAAGDPFEMGTTSPEVAPLSPTATQAAEV